MAHEHPANIVLYDQNPDWSTNALATWAGWGGWWALTAVLAIWSFFYPATGIPAIALGWFLWLLLRASLRLQEHGRLRAEADAVVNKQLVGLLQQVLEGIPDEPPSADSVAQQVMDVMRRYERQTRGV